jgi:hypothetical protein
MHFVMAMEFDVHLPHDQVQTALDATQARHPLLSVHIEDHADSRLGFYHRMAVPAIPTTVLRQDPHHWQPVAAQELSRPFDRSVAPFLRASLISESRDGLGQTQNVTYKQRGVISCVLVLNFPSVLERI